MTDASAQDVPILGLTVLGAMLVAMITATVLTVIILLIRYVPHRRRR